MSPIEFVRITYTVQNVSNVSDAFFLSTSDRVTPRAPINGVVSITQTHYIRVYEVRGVGSGSVKEELVLAGNVMVGQFIRVWDGEEYAYGKVMNVDNFPDSPTKTYVPITDKGTNFVMASGLIVPMDGVLEIDGVTVHRNYILWGHNLFTSTKRLTPSSLWNSVFAPMLVTQTDNLFGPCFETMTLMNNILTALRANNSEGLWLVSDPTKSAEVLEWLAEHMHELMGLTQKPADWSVMAASTATASLALRAISQLVLFTNQSTPIKLDVLYDATLWEQQGQVRKCTGNHIGALDFDCGGNGYVEDAMYKTNVSFGVCCFIAKTDSPTAKTDSPTAKTDSSTAKTDSTAQTTAALSSSSSPMGVSSSP